MGRIVWLLALLLLSPLHAFAAAPGATGTPGADAPVDAVGQVILDAVAGRTVEQAIADGGQADNPFGLGADPLLRAAGVYFINTDPTGAAMGQSELSILPDYVTPGNAYAASAAMPAILPFAFNRGGTCFGGYVTGYPAPDKIVAVDMTGQVCHVLTIDSIMQAKYAAMTGADGLGAAGDAGRAKTKPDAAPAPKSALFDGVHARDHDLEMLAYYAYAAAYRQALQ